VNEKTQDARALLEQRIQKARAERARLEAEAHDRAELARLEAEAEREERAPRELAALEAAEREHGPRGRKIQVVETDLGIVIVKRPHSALFRRFSDKGSMKTADLDQLVRPCVVYPDSSTLDRILDELPATLLRLANSVSELAGFRAEEVQGKS
jgi:hypothetical protein